MKSHMKPDPSGYKQQTPAAIDRHADSATPTVGWTRYGQIVVLAMQAPPVNVLGIQLRGDLLSAFDALDQDEDIACIVLTSSLAVFSAGADIKEFAQGRPANPDLNDLCCRIETMRVPVVAWIDGAALGGGLELTLSCHSRVASPRTKLGLPEVTLGLMPGAGGTVRLPRLIAPDVALDMMRSGISIDGAQGLEYGLVDTYVESGDLEGVLRHGEQVSRHPPVPTFRRPLPDFDALPDFKGRRDPALTRAREAIERTVASSLATHSFEQALEIEKSAFEALLKSAESQALRHLFFAEREALRIPGVSASSSTPEIRRVAVIGAGTMGSGIAMCFLVAGFQVHLIDVSEAAVCRGVELIRGLQAAALSKNRLRPQDIERQSAALSAGIAYEELGYADLIIEAAFEDMALKRDIWQRVGEHANDFAILASNTSTLDIDELARASGRPEDFLGMHFFSPAHIMKLLEVVRGAQTGPEALASVMKVARRIGKTVVVAGVCYGFIGNRMLEGYLRETDALLLEGATPKQIDDALERFGMAMGPCRMMDMSGLDVNANVLEQRELTRDLPGDPGYRAVCRALYGEGRLGQKNGLGYYRYDGHTAMPDEQSIARIAQLASTLGIKRRDVISDAEIVDRCLSPLIKEGHLILREGIALRASDIDVVWTAGYGFPRMRGGPMFYERTSRLNKERA